MASEFSNNRFDALHSSHDRDRASSDASATSIDLRIFIKDVHDTHGRKRPLTVRPWATIKDIKDQLTKHLHIPASSQSLYFGPVVSFAKELPNHRTLQDAGIYRNGEMLLLEIKGNCSSPAAGGGIHPRSTSELLLQSPACPHSISSLRTSSNNDICVSSSTLDLAPKALQRLIQQARRGLALGLKPALAPDGSGGSYFLCDARKKRVGVFKPADEEPFAENNPRGYVPTTMTTTTTISSHPGGEEEGYPPEECLRQGIKPGELCLREVAAYLLDHDGFSSVPMTTLAEARHPALHLSGTRWTLSEGGASVGVHSLTHSPSLASFTLSTPGSTTTLPPSHLNSSHPVAMKKIGSFQEYIHAECTMDDISPSKISIDEVHKIAILDIRIMNADRNVANILCQRIPEDPDHFRLIPIDHGYSLRSKCDVAWFDWCWLDWPQTKLPLSKASRDYVLGLDIEADARLLQERLNMKDDVLDYFRSSCQVLKAGVRAGLTLYDICSAILCRNDPGGAVPSKLETLTSMASELAMSAVHNGRFHHATASWALEEQLASRCCLTDLRSPHLSMRFDQSRSTLTRRILSTPSFKNVSHVRSFSDFTEEFSKVGSSFSGCRASVGSHTTECTPGNVLSSQSDNSSDGDDDEDDDDAVSFVSVCHEDSAAGEWAAALVAVADRSMDKFCRDRSVSESSSDGSSSALSKSPVGFWYVRPGALLSSGCASDDIDDEPICWTASLGSTRHQDAPESSLGYYQFATSKELSSGVTGDTDAFPSSGFALSNLGKLLAETPISTPITDELSNPSKYVDDKFCPLPSPIENSSATPGKITHKPLTIKMNRSMSYSAFTTHNHAPMPETSISSTLNRSVSMAPTQTGDLFRTYFIKFVDLLIVRETEHLLHNKAQLQS